MSRSVKKTAGWTDQSTDRQFAKRAANKKVRKYAELSNGSGYKRLFESWTICDYKALYHTNVAVDDFIRDEHANYAGKTGRRKAIPKYRMFMK